MRNKFGMSTVLPTMLPTILLAAMISLLGVQEARSCGGFFCQVTPINQAGEQIIFRKDGTMITAVVLIQYEGDAEDFSWVVPTPTNPEFAVGSELVFGPLELVTRPQFNLNREGSECERNLDFFDDFAVTDSAESLEGNDGGAADNDVQVVQQVAVGPFDIQVVTSTESDALARWLEENDYEIGERGPELIDDYVRDGMFFVAVRLQQNQGVGDLQPLILRYESEEFMIPIKLTAVAANDNMGVIAWLLGESRGVPLNYLHVVPNYTRLDWYSGTTNAYGSYQTLITTAMDEAGGQGFATDYAGRDLDIVSSLPDPERFEGELARASVLDSDAQFLTEIYNGFIFPRDMVLEELRRLLPVEEGQEFAYDSIGTMEEFFTAEDLEAARTAMAEKLQTGVIDPLLETIAVFDDDPYVTRVYTTLSANEMTLDPTFSFNPDLDDQSIERQATMNISCTNEGTEWTLTLGSGTDREGVTVIEATGTPPSFSTPPTIDQDSLFRSELVSTSGDPEVVDEKDFGTLQLIGDGSNGGGDGTGGGGTGGGDDTLTATDLCGALTGTGCGAGTGLILLMMMATPIIRRKMRRRN